MLFSTVAFLSQFCSSLEHGGAENAGVENAGVENAGVENSGGITYGKPSEQKTLKIPGV